MGVRHRLALGLIGDAHYRGRERERQRHPAVAGRVEQRLAERCRPLTEPNRAGECG